MLTCQLSRFHARIERRMEWKRSHIPCMYIFTYVYRPTQHTRFCILYEQLSRDRYVIYFTHTCSLSANKGVQLRFLQLHEQTSRRCFIKITCRIKSKFLSKRLGIREKSQDLLKPNKIQH